MKPIRFPNKYGGMPMAQNGYYNPMNGDPTAPFVATTQASSMNTLPTTNGQGAAMFPQGQSVMPAMGNYNLMPYTPPNTADYAQGQQVKNYFQQGNNPLGTVNGIQNNLNGQVGYLGNVPYITAQDAAAVNGIQQGFNGAGNMPSPNYDENSPEFNDVMKIQGRFSGLDMMQGNGNPDDMGGMGVLEPLNFLKPISGTTPGNYPLGSDIATVNGIQNNLNTATTDNPAPAEGQPWAKNNFDFQKAIDVGSLINNFVQAPPPNIQTPLTHLERIKLDRSPIQTIKTDQLESANKAYRSFRENSSQFSDIIKGTTAVAANTQDALRQTGAMEQELANQERGMNNQIANQEAQTQNQENMQEQLLNYQNQAQFAAQKSAAMTDNLTNIKKDVQQEAQYNITKEGMDKQEKADQKFADTNLDLQTLMMQYQASKDFESSDEYTKGYGNAMTEYANEAHAGIQKDMPQYANFSMNDFAQSDKRVEHHTQQIALLEPGIKAAEAKLLTETDATKKSQLQAQIDQLKAQHTESKQSVDFYGNYAKELRKRFSESTKSQEYRSKYIKDRGIISDADFINQTKSIAERSRYNKK